jgi:hypothetical protein
MKNEKLKKWQEKPKNPKNKRRTILKTKKTPN